MMNPTNDSFYKDVYQAAEYVLSVIQKKPVIAVVLGSGLSDFADTAFTSTRGEISYNQIPGFPVTTVAGHRGTMYYGEIHGKMSICFAGRFHSYEGHPPHILTLLPRLAAEMGCRVYILTNAAGGTLHGMQTGCLMSITSHGATTRFTGVFGCENIGCGAPPYFSNASYFIESMYSYDYPAQISAENVYSKQLCSLAASIATDPQFIEATQFELAGQQRTVELHEGTYMFNSGPTFESHAETRYCLENAPGVVGMSSAPEALMARALGMHVYGMSLVTNLASGLSDEVLAHEDVTRVATCVSNAVKELISRLIKQIDFKSLGPIRKLGQLAGNDPLIPINEAYATQSEVESFAAELSGAELVVLYTANIDGDYTIKKIDTTAFVAVKRQIGLRVGSMIILGCKHMGITDINFVDRSLPSSVMIHCSEVINMTSWQYFPFESVRSVFGNQPHDLMLVDGWENPRTSIYFTSVANREEIKHLSNCTSAVPVVLADMLGVNLYVVAPNLCLRTHYAHQVYPCKLTTFTPRFNTFECSVPTYEEAESIAKRLPSYEKVIIFDLRAYNHRKNADAMLEKLGAIRIPEITEFEAYYNGTVVMLLIPPLYANNTFKEIALVARVVSFNKYADILVLCNCCDECFEVTDICNQASINPLRGPNDERFGPRFNDLTNIISGRRFKKLKGHIAVLTLAPMLKCQEAASTVGPLIAEGGLQILVVLSHQGGGKRWAACGRIEELVGPASMFMTFKSFD